MLNRCAYQTVRITCWGTLTDGPDERKEWIVGADSAKVLRRETVHGEARIDRIVLPKVGEREGGYQSDIAIVSCWVSDAIVATSCSSHARGPSGRTKGTNKGIRISKIKSEVAFPRTHITLWIYMHACLYLHLQYFHRKQNSLAHRNPTKLSLSFLRPKTKKHPAKQAAQDGGQWVLRVEDVSHGGDKDEDRSTGRARGLGLAESVASEAVAVASPTEEELKAFLPLPTETVKLERA